MKRNYEIFMIDQNQILNFIFNDEIGMSFKV